MGKDYFVKTNDKDTADILRESGFVELEKEGDKWVFLNNSGKADFSSLGGKVYVDNKLSF